MNKFNRFCVSAIAAVMFVGATTAMANAKMGDVPIEAWALRDVVRSVSVSPDGKHIVLMKIASKKGDPVLVIYKTNDLSKPYKTLDAKPMEFLSVRWVSDSVLVGAAAKMVKNKVKAPEDDVRKYKFYAYSLDTGKFSEAQGAFSVVGNLPKEPNHVLIQSTRAVPGGPGVDPFADFRPRSYYKFNLKTGSKSLVLKGSDKFPTASFDVDGNPVFTQVFDPDSKEIISYYRLPGDKNWTPFKERLDGMDPKQVYRQFSGFYGYQGSKHDDSTIAYIIDSRGGDKAALWEFDLKTGEFGKKLYENPTADVMGIVRNSNFWSGNRKLAAAIYPGAKYERHWFDLEEKALLDSVSAKIPNAHQTSIGSRSRDGNTMIVSNSGPKDPGSYWLVHDGKMSKLGSRNPLVKPANLSNVEFIKYKARDGLTIPAYVTKPKGSGPFPLIVLPHGGPHVNEVIGYDEWGQLLANNGYMVLQPQYRISVGWGQKHFDAGYGEHGLKMQDDKDDGALHLIEKGWADKDRVAMFGYSYGGYAAHIAASRTPQIYQCAIAGAAVGDAKKRYYQRSKGASDSAGNEWSKRRGGLYGINPIEEVDKLNIPQLLIHGTVDFRVEYFNATDYMKAANKAGKGNLVELLTLKDAGHTIGTHYYEHNESYYTKLLDYLENDCGPGGL